VTVVGDETMGDKDPLLAKLLAAATSGAPPAGWANKRKPVRIVLDPDDRRDQGHFVQSRPRIQSARCDPRCRPAGLVEVVVDRDREVDLIAPGQGGGSNNQGQLGNGGVRSETFPSR
jgi:hypothetical protein